MSTVLGIAGLILGVIPVVITGIDYYKRGLGEKEVRQLHRSLKVQNDIFYCCIEELLASLTTDSQLVALLQDPGGPEWNDEGLQLPLKVHLDHVYDSFFEAVEDIKTMVTELQETLQQPVDSNELPNSKQPKIPRKILKKLKIFMSRSRNEKGLQRLTLKVSQLETLVRQSSRLAPARRERTSPTKTYRHIQESASDLYGALALGWDCNCETKHYANLLLEVRRSSDHVHDAEDVGFRFVVAFATCDREQPSKWREVEIARLGDDLFVKSMPGMIQRKAPSVRQRPHQALRSSGNAQNIHLRPLTIQGLDRSTAVGKSVSFKNSNFPTTVPLALDKEPQEIEDLCQWIKDNEGIEWNSESCLGYLRDGVSKKRYGLYSVTDRKLTTRPWASIPLAQVLSPTPNFSRRVQAPRHRKLSLAARVRLALTLGSTILQLHSTPWLDEAWDKHDIHFLPESKETQSDTVVQPYLTREFRLRKSLMSSPNSPIVAPPVRQNTEKAWSKWVRNETLFTLGIMLIKLALNRSIEQLTEPEEYGPSVELNSRGSWAECFTAFRLLKVIREEVGSKYERAVAGCLYCDFGLNNTDLSLQNEEVQMNVLKYIVAPLEESLEFYTSQEI